MKSSCRLQSELGPVLVISSTSRSRIVLYWALYYVCSPGRKGHTDLTSSPPSSPLERGSLNRVLEPHGSVATAHRGCARVGTEPNISRHELTTAMQHLCKLSLAGQFAQVLHGCRRKTPFLELSPA